MIGVLEHLSSGHAVYTKESMDTAFFKLVNRKHIVAVTSSVSYDDFCEIPNGCLILNSSDSNVAVNVDDLSVLITEPSKLYEKTGNNAIVCRGSLRGPSGKNLTRDTFMESYGSNVTAGDDLYGIMINVNFLHLLVQFECQNPIGDECLLGKLKPGFRPRSSIRVPGVNYGVAPAAFGYFCIDRAGYFYWKGQAVSTGTSLISGQVFYPVEPIG